MPFCVDIESFIANVTGKQSLYHIRDFSSNLRRALSNSKAHCKMT